MGRLSKNDNSQPVRRAIKYKNVKTYYPLLGIVLCSLYLLAGVYSYACFGISDRQKSEIVSKMENSESVREACNVGRPFISATFNLTQLGARFLALSLIITGGNLLLFIIIRKENQKHAGQTKTPLGIEKE